MGKKWDKIDDDTKKYFEEAGSWRLEFLTELKFSVGNKIETEIKIICWNNFDSHRDSIRFKRILRAIVIENFYFQCHFRFRRGCGCKKNDFSRVSVEEFKERLSSLLELFQASSF